MAKGRKTGGRTAGTPNKATGELRNKIANLLNDKFSDIEDNWEDLEPKEQSQLYTSLLKYVIPTLQSVQYSEEKDKDLIAERLKKLSK